MALHLANPSRYPHLLESALKGPGGRFDILFAFPGETLVAEDEGFLKALDEGLGKRLPPSPLPFAGGWFLYLGYGLGGCLEPRLALPRGPFPLALATYCPAALIKDHREGRVYLVAEHPALLRAMERDLAALRALERPAALELLEPPPAPFLEGVQRAKAYIREGDVYQVNLSRPWRGRARGRPGDLYARLRAANPAPFAGLATWEDWAIVSSSPERLVRVKGRRIEACPIAGTHPREGEDEAQRKALIAHPKERAEHIMLVDLARNDLGRICRPGSVRVAALLTLETYATVHHLVSSVTGELEGDVPPGEVIRALFPGGTITGCPKVRAMEVIAEIEGEDRGPYTGSMGYLSRDGGMDLNILIRTLVLRGEQAELRAGAGIVADSLPERELWETRAKAEGVIRAFSP